MIVRSFARPTRSAASLVVALLLCLTLPGAAALANTAHLPKPANLEGSVFLVTTSKAGVSLRRLDGVTVEVHGPPDATAYSTGVGTEGQTLGEYAVFSVPAGLYMVDATATPALTGTFTAIDCTPTEKGALDGTGKTFALLQLAAGQTVTSDWYCLAPST
jgi:hypothetical protein